MPCDIRPGPAQPLIDPDNALRDIRFELAAVEPAVALRPE